MCRHWIFGKAVLPHRDELCPLFVSIQSYTPEYEAAEKAALPLPFILYWPLSWKRIVFRISRTTFAKPSLTTMVLYVDHIEQAQRLQAKESNSLESGTVLGSQRVLGTVDEEQKLLSFNLPATGSILDHFVCSLGRVLQ